MANKELLLIKKSSPNSPAQIVNRSGVQKKTSAPVQISADKKISRDIFYNFFEQARKDIASHIAANKRKDSITSGEVAQLTNLLDSLTDNQRKALDDAIASNPNAVAKNKGRSLENDKVWQYANAIVNLTDADGNVNYKASKYEFNPYTNGQPDEIARKAFESLSVEDQLRLEISDNGKPKTPKFGDPNADLTAYENYQKALAKAEQDAIDKADSDAVKAMEDAYRNNRGNYEYDAKATAKAIKDSNKQVSYTQSELVDLYEALQDKYDWDDEAYAEWNTPAPFTNASNKIVSTQNVKRESENPAGSASTPTTPVMTEYVPSAAAKIVAGKSDVKATAEATKQEAEKQAASTFVATDAEPAPQYDSVKMSEAYYAAKDAGASDDEAWKAAYSAVYTPEELAAAEKARDNYMAIKGNTAFMRTMAKLTGKDKIEYWARANKDGSFENDAKYMANQAVQGIGDVVSGIALLAGGATWATINAATSTTWLIANGGKPWSMDELRSRFAPLDDIMYVAETSGSGKYNTLNEAGKEKAGEVAQFIGNLGRSFMSSTTAGSMGAAIGNAFPKLTTTLNLSNALGDKASPAIKTLAKVVPEVQVGVNQVPFLTQSFASGYNEALATGYDQAGALVWGSWTALAEGIPESISWNWSAATGSNLKSQVYGSLNKDAAKTATKKGLKNLMARIGESGAAKVLAALNAEGMSEVMTNYLDWFGRKTLMNQDVDLPTLRENLVTYGTGALLSAITQGFSYAASTPARKQAEAIVDGMVNGQAPTSEQVQALNDSLNDAAAHEPISNERLDELSGEGLKVDEKTTEAYRAANDAFHKAEQGATAALQRLQQMNEQGVPFGSPERVAAVKDYVESRKEYASASQKRKDAHAKFLSALDGMVQETETAAAEAEAEQQRIAEEYAEWQYTEMLQNDPKGLLTVATELQNAVNEDLAAAKTALHQAGFADPATRSDLMVQVKNLQASNAKLQEMIDAATTAIAPTIAEEATSEQDGTNTAPAEATPEQGNNQFYATAKANPEAMVERLELSAMEAEYAGDNERAAKLRELASEIAEYAKSDATTEAESVAKRIRELSTLRDTTKSKTKLAAIEQEYDALQKRYGELTGVGPEEIAASYSSTRDGAADYMAAEERGGIETREAVLAAENAPVIADDINAVTVPAKPAQAVTPKAEPVKTSEITETAKTAAAPVDKYQQYAPDFSNKNVKYGKAAAAEFVKNVEAAGEKASDIAAYALDKKTTTLKAKERAFWENVEKNITQAPQKKGAPKVMAFKPTPQQETSEDVVKALDPDTPYVAADSTNMKYEPSNYETVRKPSAIKNDIQNILGFHFSDEHFRRDQRKAGATAYYEPATKFITSDDTNDLPSFLHDAGHHVALDQYAPDEVDEFKQMVPRKFLESYPDDAHTSETAAEMFRAWMMRPESMERTFPETFEGMKKALGNAKYNKLRNQSAAIRKWMASDTQQKVSSIHRTTRDQENAKKEPEFSKFIKREADSEYGFKVLDRAMERAGVTLASSADARASCARTSSEAVHALLFDGIYDPNTGKKVCCGLVDTTKGLVKTAQDKETLEVYLTLKQSYERFTHNNKDWTLSKDVCTPAEAKAYIENVENNHPNIHQAAKNIWEYLKNYRHTNLSSAIPQSVIDAWDKQNQYYIPQTRVFTNNIRSAIKGGGVSGAGTGVNRRGEGSTRDFLAPSDAIIQMITTTKTAALKHETLKTLQEYYDADTTGTIGNYLHEVEPGVYVTPVDGGTVTDATMKALKKGELNEDTMKLVSDILEGNSPETVVYKYGDPNGRKNNIVAITENGHTRYFEVMDQDLMDAVAPMSKQQLNAVFEAINKVQRMTSSLITSNNPFFATSNAIRDFVTGYVTGSEQNPFKYARDYVGAAVDVVKDTFGKDESGIVAQYRAMGGGGGLSQSFATAENVNDVTSAMYGKAGDNRIAIKRSLDKMGAAIEALNGGVETIPRLAEYKRQLAAGASFPEAIKAAKNVTTDFSTSGTHSKMMSTVWRFYSAQVNGLYKTYNLFTDGKTSPKQKQILNKRMGALAGTIAASTLIHALNYIFDDDDEYAALPDYIKEGYYIFPAGKPGKFIRIPKPNDPLLVAADSIARNFADAALGIVREGADVGDTIRQEAGDILSDLITAVLPIGEVNTANPLGSNFVGNAALQWANNKTWTGATVVPQSMEKMSPALQYDDDTSWVSKMIGKVVNISPMKLDNFLDQNTGVIGEVSDAISEGIETGKQEGVVKGVAAGFKEAFLSRFLVDSAYSQGVTSSFYDMKSDLQRLVDDVEYSIEMGDGPYSTVIKGLTPQQMGQASKEAEARLKAMNNAAKQLKELGQLATKAEEAGDKEKAREYRLKQQELAATAAIESAEFFDKWKNINK